MILCALAEGNLSPEPWSNISNCMSSSLATLGEDLLDSPVEELVDELLHVLLMDSSDELALFFSDVHARSASNIAVRDTLMSWRAGSMAVRDLCGTRSSFPSLLASATASSSTGNMAVR
eukprot:CAMPEP_0195051778 /NCGR_PEP_ID=MMETSP0448-20130528/1251_1 /TAXON_ID=66468 /ORGANISM="Heterocapsa triquestra, Strain CCMP 448" /LENGTH=118 /DNA_ID=CAMNT_0040080819 /DNA_START=228 /DNA_END=581 /DNA_ORIENTATION=-